MTANLDITTLGRRLRLERERRGLTLEQASGLAGVSRPALAVIETGGCCPKVNTLLLILQAYGLKLVIAEEQ
jgi:transcriptional regulator with XRE-family HTH domain